MTVKDRKKRNKRPLELIVGGRYVGCIGFSLNLLSSTLTHPPQLRYVTRKSERQDYSYI